MCRIDQEIDRQQIGTMATRKASISSLDFDRCVRQVALTVCFLVLLNGSTAQLIKNRSVNCNSQHMEVQFEFAQPFSGVVYAQAHYGTPECRWTGDGSRLLSVPIPLNIQNSRKPFCGVTVEQTTGEFEATLVITPMKGLLVDGMAGLSVRCVYNIGDVTLTLPAGSNGAGILISPQSAQPSNIVTGSGGSPFLQMAIRDGHGINGEVVQAASVGQRITLDVVMKDTAIYDFYVHDCYAHDGTNTPEASITIIDVNGCAVHLERAVGVPVFTTPSVAGGAKHVYVHMYGFQFTTSQLVFFECQVRPCLQSCNRQQCEATGNSLLRSKRSALLRSVARAKRQSNAVEEESLQDEYHLKAVLQIRPSRDLNVIPARDDPLQFRDAKVSPDTAGQVCLPTALAVAVVGLFLLLCVASSAIAAFICCRTAVIGEKTYDDRSEFRSSILSGATPIHRRRARGGGLPGGVNYYTPTSTPSREPSLSSPAGSSAIVDQSGGRRGGD